MSNGLSSDFSSFEKNPERLAEEIARRERERRERGGKTGNGHDPWADPEPLFEPHEAERRYPLNALPEIMSVAVEEYRAYGQQPRAIIAMSAIAATSLACQGLVDVERDARLVGPVSLNFSVVAISGERKTSADRQFAGPIRKWQTEKRESMASGVDAAKARLAVWNAERKGLLSKIEGSSRKKGVGGGADIAALKDQLVILEQNKPSSVILPTLFYEDVNAETLAVELASGWPSASLWSDEGGLVIGSNGMNDENLMKFMALLNKLWDGASFDRDRSTVKSAHIRGRRFTVSLMMQPIVMARLLGACGGTARNIGFVARNLVAWPGSTIGSRFYKDPPAEMSATNAFNARVRQLLDMDLKTEGPELVLAPSRVKLSYEAKKVWVEYHDSIESELSCLGEFGDVTDIGSKIAENAARMAGVFHTLVNGPEGEIAEELMKGAISVVTWHLNEARRIINASGKPQDVADAELLLEWFLKQEAKPIDPRDILRLGPGRLRDKKRRDAALEILSDKHWIFESGNPARFTLNPKARGVL